MNPEIEQYLEKYSEKIIAMFMNLREIVMGCQSEEVEEKMWAKLPSYYVGENFVRFIPFKDHLNVEAKAFLEHKEELGGYKMTPKGMLQIFIGQDMPTDVMKQVFVETLEGA